MASEAGRGVLLSSRRPRRLCRALHWLAAGVLVLAAPARAQTPSPSPPPDRLQQDDLDLQARSNVVQGSGARAFGMGGAFLARADDATAASWNPAGLSYLRRPEVSIVWAAINRFDDTLGNPESGAVITQDRRRGGAPDFLAAAYPFELRSVTGAAQISFQRVISFSGRRTIQTPTGTTDVDSGGGFDVLALGSGWQLLRKLRIGATLNRWLNGYHQTLERDVPRGRTTRQDVDFGFSGWNIHLGLIVSPWESLNLGAVAKTAFSADVDLRRRRVDTPLDGSPPTSNEFEQPVVLDFPGAIGLGASWRPRSAVTLSADYTRTFWSNGRIRNFFTLPRAVAGRPRPEPQPPDDVFDVLPYPSLFDFSGKGQTDTQQTRVGVEYVLIRDRLKVPLRAGFFIDGQYFRGANGEPPRFDGWTAGTGLIVGPMLLDVAYVYESSRYDGFDNFGNVVRNSIRAHRLLVSAIYRHSGSR